LEPIFLAYEIGRAFYSPDEKAQVEAWIRQIAQKEIDTNGWRDRKDSARHLDNWDAKQFKIVGVAGWVLSEPKFINYAQQGFKNYIALGLFPDGTSDDLKKRDALSYHVSGLKPLLVMALWAENHAPGEGAALVNYVAPSGASLRKSIEYVVPFAEGTKVHEEWKNTTVELDRQRAAAGIAYYKPGKHYDPLASLELFELASIFDPKFASVAAQLRRKKGEETNWLSLVASAAKVPGTSVK
jgi:hypothetical protein